MQFSVSHVALMFIDVYADKRNCTHTHDHSLFSHGTERKWFVLELAVVNFPGELTILNNNIYSSVTMNNNKWILIK